MSGLSPELAGMFWRLDPCACGTLRIVWHAWYERYHPDGSRPVVVSGRRTVSEHPMTANSNAGGGAGTASFGPLASSLRDIDLFNRSILEADWSFIGYPQPHIPWTPALKSASGEGRKLRVGVMRHDGVVVPQPPILRGLDTVVQKLEASG